MFDSLDAAQRFSDPSNHATRYERGGPSMTFLRTLSSVRMIRIGLLLVTTALCMASMPQVDASGQVQTKSLGAHIEQVTGPNAVNCGRIDHTRNDEHALK